MRSTSADQSKLAVYGARRTRDGRYTIVVVNKTATELTSHLSLAGLTPTGNAQVFRWAGSGIARLSNLAVPASGFSATYPARSITLYSIPAA